ncbi:DinB family protein [Marihabitans asiaticum]|uniref:Uncharacterized protein DUF664 n=2 Tax=Marihabitans asiaticum TaxID=415218 RepID=A0A560W6J9_9MICO|nr:uncharacterized protein DUF664 [Marihabitans asiaticum]
MGMSASSDVLRVLLTDAARRPEHSAEAVLEGIDDQTLHRQVRQDLGSVAWLVWHAAAQLDAQVADLAGRTSVWEGEGWSERLGVRRDQSGPAAFGLGDGPEEIAALRVSSADELLAYVRSVVAAVVTAVQQWSPEDLGEVIDESWDPPVTRGVRLISAIDDAAQHLGQAAYLRGLLDGWTYGV